MEANWNGNSGQLPCSSMQEREQKLHERLEAAKLQTAEKLAGG